MSMKQFRYGIEMIDKGLEEELSRNRVLPSEFKHRETDTNPPHAIYSVTANGQTEEMTFNYEDVADSHSGLVPAAKGKIEILVLKIASLPGTTNPYR